MNSIEVAFEGRLGQAPTLRTSQTGKPWLAMSLAVGGDEGGDGKQWVSVSVFGTQAEALVSIEPGTRVYCEGRLKLETWQDRDGRERSGLKVTAWRVELLGQIGKRKPAKVRGDRGGDLGGTAASDQNAKRDWQRPLADDAIPF